MPGEVEVLKVCPMDDSFRFSAREGSQTPSSNAIAAGPSHWSPDYGITVLPATYNPTAGQKSHPWGPEDLPLALPSSEAWAVVGSQPDMVLFASETVPWLQSVLSAFPWFPTGSEVLSGQLRPWQMGLVSTPWMGFLGTNPSAPFLTRSVQWDMLPWCSRARTEIHIALPQRREQRVDADLWTRQPLPVHLCWTMWGAASVHCQPSPPSQQRQRNLAGPTLTRFPLRIPLHSLTRPTLIVHNILKTTQLELQSIQWWIKITIALSEAMLLAKKISSGKTPPLGSFAAKDWPVGFMTDSMPHVRLTAMGKTWEELQDWWLPLNLAFVLIPKRESMVRSAIPAKQ